VKGQQPPTPGQPMPNYSLGYRLNQVSEVPRAYSEATTCAQLAH